MTATHPRTDQERILEQIALTVKEGQKFRYAHHRSDISTEFYARLIGGQQKLQSLLMSLNPIPQAYPRQLMYFRQRFHQRLGMEKDFIHVLSMKDLRADTYFSHMETIIRFSLGQVLRSSYISTPMRYSLAGSKAEQYAHKVSDIYFRGRELERIIATVLQVDHTNPIFLRHVDIERMSVDVATPYVATLFQANFSISQLIAGGGEKPALPHMSVLDCNFAFEAGHHIGHELATQLMDAVMIPFQVPRVRLMSELLVEVTKLAELQAKRQVLQGIHGRRIMNILINDAGTYIPQIIARLHERYGKEHRTVAPVPVAPPPPPKPPEAKTLSGNGSVEDRISQIESREAIEAGKEIIEYLRRMQFGDKGVGEQQRDMPTGDDTADTDDDAEKKNDTSRAPGQKDDEMEQQFEVAVGTQQKQLMTLTAIINVLRRGRNVTFSSNAHLKMFLRAAYVKTGGNLGFRVTQLRYLEKGIVKETGQRMAEEMIQDLQIDKERAERDKAHDEKDAKGKRGERKGEKRDKDESKDKDKRDKEKEGGMTGFMMDSKEVSAQKDLKSSKESSRDKLR